jgi:sortase A
MPLYSYVKYEKTPRKKAVGLVASICCIFSGLSMLVWVLYPIIAFEIFYAPKFNDLIMPVPNQGAHLSLGNDLSQVLGAATADYTKASVWFPRAVNIKLAASSTSYTLSVPRFGIDHAVVMTGSENLDQSLIHYTGPMPGNYGNPVIFGHSTLPFLYNPKNYKTIFTRLPELNRGDDIYVDVDKVTYKYKVYDMKVVTPDDLSVLEQSYDSSYVTLVTCVPPGTTLRRLIVRGKLSTNT